MKKEAIDMLKLPAQGEDDFRKGRTVSQKQVFKQFKKKLKRKIGPDLIC